MQHPSAPAREVGRIAAALKHPVWISVGTLVSVAAIVLGVYFGGHPAGGSSGVQLAEVSFGELTPIKAVDACGAACGQLDETPPLPDTTTTPVDITIKNSTQQPFKIVRVDAEVLANDSAGCMRAGGGTVISAFYTIKIPTGRTGTATPGTVSAPVDYTVKPQSTDRMVVTVGPDKLYFDPEALLVRLHLIPESGEPLVTEPLAMVPPSSIPTQAAYVAKSSGSQNSRTCFREVSTTLGDLAARSSIQNAGFLELKKLFDDAPA